MTEDPSVKEVLSAAASIPKKAGKALLGAKVPVNRLRRFGQAVARQWLAIVVFSGLFLWVFVDHLAMVEEAKKMALVRHQAFMMATGSIATTDEEYIAERARAAAIAERSVIGAAFQNENMIGSFFSAEAMGAHNRNDPEFDLLGYIKDNDLQGYEDEFYGVLNKTYADVILADLRREMRNKETLVAAGWAGVLAALAARLLDLPGLVLIGAFLWGRRPYAGTASA